jgi:hypothetical protein
MIICGMRCSSSGAPRVAAQPACSTSNDAFRDADVRRTRSTGSALTLDLSQVSGRPWRTVAWAFRRTQTSGLIPADVCVRDGQEVLVRKEIPPLTAVVPANEDPKLQVNDPDWGVTATFMPPPGAFDEPAQVRPDHHALSNQRRVMRACPCCV